MPLKKDDLPGTLQRSPRKVQRAYIETLDSAEDTYDGDEERELIKRLAEFSSVVADAAVKRGPQSIPAYAIRVADDFHRFYHEHRVLESEQEAFRLALCLATQRVIARSLDLLGVDAPESM